MPTFDPYTQQITQQQRRQQFAQMLLQQGMQQDPTQMVGNVAIRQNPLSALAKGLAAYQGVKEMGSADEKISGIIGEKDAAEKAAIQKGMELFNAGDVKGATAAFSATPNGQAYAAELMKSQLTPPPADQRTFEWLQTQPTEVQDAYKKYQTVSQGNYNTPIATSGGYYGFNNRGGSATPLFGPDGKPLMPVPADAVVQGNVAQAKAVGTGQGEAEVAPIKALAAKTADKQIEAQFNAPTALALFDDFEKAVMRQPATPLGRGAESVAGYVGLGNEDQQKAIAEGETIASQLMAYAEKLPGPASDKDRIDFKASIGAYAAPGATKAQRLAALRQAKKSFERTIKKYGAGAPGAAAGATPPAGRFQIEVVQ